MIKKPDSVTWPNDDDSLWRYMNLTKFMSLLTSESLHFTRANFLGDNLEGSLPQKDAEKREDKIGTQNSRRYSLISKKFKEQVAISCWHKNNYESAAMWKIYSGKDHGIGIKTNFRSFKNSLNKSEVNIFIGEVNYIDYKKGELGNRDDLYRYFHKYRSYKYEQEVRALIWPKREENNIDSTKKGYFLPVNLDRLIDKIYLSPNSPDYFYKMIEEIVDSFNIKNAESLVMQSDMAIDPIY